MTDHAAFLVVHESLANQARQRKTKYVKASENMHLPSTLPEALAAALEHHDAGRLDRAEQIYRQILQMNPGHVDALQLLGVLQAQTGNYASAVDLLTAALRVKGDEPGIHTNLGGVYLSRGDVSQALACYRRALELKPDYVEAHYGMGRAHEALGNLDEAGACYQQAVHLKPDYVDALFNLGNVLAKTGRPADAVARYQRAVALKPNNHKAYYNLGHAQLNLGTPAEAAASYQRASQLKPDYAEAHAGLGLAMRGLGRLDEAAACLERALAIDPHLTLAHNNLGNILKEKGKLAEALACYRRAVAHSPDDAMAGSNVLNLLHFCPGYDSAALYEEHRRWYQRHAEPLWNRSESYTNDPAPERRLRIGYVSPDFRDHVVGRNVLPLLRHHNAGQFDITLYANHASADELTEQFRAYAHNWRVITGWTDERVAEQIRRDGIDILVDLTLHMAQNRLLVFARKPAPVQVTFAGYPGTTGIPAIDYRLTDPYLDPPGLFDACYAEESYQLPDSFWCYDPLTSEPAVSPLPALRNGYVTFGCLSNFCKVNAAMLKTWAAVLRGVGGSRLMLLAPDGRHRSRVLDVLAAESVAGDRVRFVAGLPRPRYLELYHHIDIGLDTLPYNGHTTSLDSLWMGVPVVTLVGGTVAGRAGLSQLSNLGLNELVARNAEDFVRIAAELAMTPALLSSLRAELRARMQGSPLMDAPRFTRGIEAAYRDMWRQWCAAR
jgi:predicted O-linked N-acetylglucosamine transferase (SPINDLY family)